MSLRNASKSPWSIGRSTAKNGWPRASLTPVVGGPPQTQPLSGDIAFGQRSMAAMIEANVPVDVQGAGQFRRGLQPVPGQEPGPFLRAVIETQGRPLAPQTTDFGNAVQPQQLAQLTRGLVLQLLDGLDAARRHVGQQDDHVQRAVVAAQLNKAIVEMWNRPFSARAGKPQSTPPKESRGRARNGSGLHPERNAAGRAGPAGCTPCPSQPRHLRRPSGLSVAMGGWRAAA